MGKNESEQEETRTSESDASPSPAAQNSEEVVEFLKLVEQARSEAESIPNAIPVLAETPAPKAPQQGVPKKYKFGLKKKAKEPKEPIQVLIREAQGTPISPYISAVAVLVALFVAVASVMTTML